jgi:hypothetical protein
MDWILAKHLVGFPKTRATTPLSNYWPKMIDAKSLLDFLPGAGAGVLKIIIIYLV